ncbi:hypothetical protein ES703_69856 [subsurface metagenome]
MSKGMKKSRPTTEHLIFLILYRHDGQKGSYGFGITVKEIQEELSFEAGRRPSTRHIRRLIVTLEDKGAIERDFNYLHGGHLGNEGQANRYIVKDIAKGFDFLLTDQELQIREETLKEQEGKEPSLPGSFYRHGYRPSKAYIKGYAPFYQAATRVNLSPKFPKGDPRNYERQKIVNNILIKKKREISSTLL